MHPGLIIVSNRLPVSVKKTGGKLEFYPSVGGLATGLASYANDRRNKWIGWPGLPSDDLSEKDRQQIAEELQKSNCYPVFLTKKQIDEFYNGYSNGLLWLLFHDREMSAGVRKNEDKLWHAYERVNKQFAEAVLALSDSGDTIWVHDYQLMLLPALLRLERPYDKIGFFLHIPFPKVAQLEQIAAREALIAGMLGASLIGLHIDPYVQNFLDAVQQYDIGLIEHHKVILQDRVVRVTDFPMGIDYAKYEKARKSRAVTREYAKLRLQYAGQKVILTVDRLDPSKGLVERAKAFQTLLRENPKLRGKVVMIMLVVPSRTDILEYQQLKDELEAVIQETNQEFSLMAWKPIEYRFEALPFEQVTALYRRANVAFITPLRDGMNLVAKEYLASKPYQRGVLVLSRSAGAAQELKGAVMVDPLRPKTLVRGLKKALAMPPKEFKRRVGRMQKQLSTRNVHVWAKSFTKSLSQDLRLPANRTRTLTALVGKPIEHAYETAQKRLLLLDYDGVLAPFAAKPDDAKPSTSLLRVLRELSGRKDTTIVLISGRSKDKLDEWFGKLAINLVAEHGSFTKYSTHKNWHVTPNDALAGWKRVIQPTLEKYAAKTPGAFVEAKSAALVWHYRKASPYYAQKYLVTLKRALTPLARKYGLEVRQGNMILEIRPHGIDKGTSALAWLEKTGADFTLCLGDDYTDEDMFTALPPTAYTVKIGRGRTSAHYRLKNTDEVLGFLQRLAKL